MGCEIVLGISDGVSVHSQNFAAQHELRKRVAASPFGRCSTLKRACEVFEEILNAKSFLKHREVSRYLCSITNNQTEKAGLDIIRSTGSKLIWVILMASMGISMPLTMGK